MSQANQRSQPGPKLLPPSLPAPRASIRTAEQGRVIGPAPDAELSGAGFREAFLNAFGTTDEIVAQALYEQLLSALNAASGAPIDDDTANVALALVHALAPKDAAEAMLISQLVVAHTAAMDASRRGLHVEQTAAGRATYLGLARKLMTLFTAQMDALNRHRGTATVQRVIVEKV